MSHDAHALTHDDHSHGHGSSLPAECIIPEDGGADRFLIALAFACLLGLFAFGGIMLSTPPHHEGGAEHGTHEGAPAGAAENSSEAEHH